MKNKTLTQIRLDISVYLRYLYQGKGMKEEELLKVYPKLSKATIYDGAKKPVADKTLDNRKYDQTPNSSPNSHSARAIWVLFYQTTEN